MKQIVIEWLDARSEDGWSEEKDLDMHVAKVTSMGHLVQETEDVLCVAASVDARTGQLSGIMFIPQVCILKRYSVSEPAIQRSGPEWATLHGGVSGPCATNPEDLLYAEVDRRYGPWKEDAE